MPQQLFDEAAERLEAFYLKLISWADVVAWADAWILKLSQIPEELIEVSLSQPHSREGKDALLQLAKQGHYDTVLHFLKGIWQKRYATGQIDFRQIVQEIYFYNESNVMENGDRMLWLGDEAMFTLELVAWMEEPEVEYLYNDEEKSVLLKSLETDVLQWLSND